MEFKGTKGNWKRVLKESYPRTNEIQYGEDSECVAEFVHNDYDAILISKAPEMLEMLKIISNGFDDSKKHLIIKKTKELIKEITEI